MNKTKSVINWIGCIFFLLSGITYFTVSLSGIAFVLLSVLLCPLFMKFLKKVDRKPKKFIHLILGMLLFVIGFSFVPKTNIENQKETQNITASINATKENNKIVEQDIQDDNEEVINDKTGIIEKDNNQDEIINEVTEKQDKDEIGINVSTSTNTNMQVHFIDVGQGDSILIESDGHYMLIDAGENNKGNMVVNYLKAEGVETLDYVIGTHPHSDHIGGLDKVIDAFDVEKVIMSNAPHNTQTFEDVLVAVSNKGLKITTPKVGTEYSIGNSKFTIIAPNKTSYSNLNNYSVGIKLENGNNAFIMCGDAELEAEYDILDNGIDIIADVLKLGHHGSDTATSEAILKAVNPTYAVISVGEDNQYGHPHNESMQKMIDRKIQLFRTDLQGTIIATSNGENITFNAKPSEIKLNKETQVTPDKTKTTPVVIPAQEDTKEITVYVTETGSKYHRDGCRYLKKSKFAIDLNNAKQDYDACSVCNPPQ